MTQDSRQQRRARERAAVRASIQTRVTGRVRSARSVQDIWRTFADEVLRPRGITADDDVGVEALLWFRRAFYAGAAAMFDLTMRVAPVERLGGRRRRAAATLARGIGDVREGATVTKANVFPSRYYGRTTANGPLLPAPAGVPDAIICRRVADYLAGQIPDSGAFSTCADCGAGIVYNPAGPHPTVRKICMQCARIQPLSITDDAS